MVALCSVCAFCTPAQTGKRGRCGARKSHAGPHPPHPRSHSGLPLHAGSSYAGSDCSIPSADPPAAPTLEEAKDATGQARQVDAALAALPIDAAFDSTCKDFETKKEVLKRSLIERRPLFSQGPHALLRLAGP
mmetsp:Transcript_145253/g.404835  ORF Transcript_145253/g.404835 Transcript_145253/m.404835 type:complete len:133 (+) Transcript_145253:117-515(+)